MFNPPSKLRKDYSPVVHDSLCGTTLDLQYNTRILAGDQVGGKFDVDALTLLTTKVDAMTQKLDRLNVSAMNSYAPSPSCDRCGSHDHVTENCEVRNPFATSAIKHVVYVNNI